jgi:hypothetical protein
MSRNDAILGATLNVVAHDRFLRTPNVIGPQSNVNSTLLGTDTPHVFFVDSAIGVNSAGIAQGQDPREPYDTIDYAIGKCVANRGDIIYVAPGHTETISAAAGIALDVAGVSIIGLGWGTLKPTITHGTVVGADFNISAANVLVKNLRFVSAINDLTNFLDIDVGNVIVEDCDFVTASALEAITFIDIATTFDDFVFRRCRFFQPTDPAGVDGGAGTGCIFMVDSENIFVEDCEFYGNFETAIFHNRTTACKNLWVKDCRGIQSLSGAEPFQLVDGANGAMLGGGFITPAEAAATEATLVGTVGNSFFVLQSGSFGNDGGAGGQGGIIIATAS